MKLLILLIGYILLLSADCSHNDVLLKNEVRVSKAIDELKEKSVKAVSPRENESLKINTFIKKLVVNKSQKKLYVYFRDTFKVFMVSLGGNPIGHKQQQGDNKTPEGQYKISLKNPKSQGYKSLKISYPNNNDRKHAMAAGVDPGGDIYIHGLWTPTQDPKNHWRYNWTRGCIALNNEQMDEIYAYTRLNTEIMILP